MRASGGSRPSLSHGLSDGLHKHALVVPTSLVHGKAAEAGLFDILSLGGYDPHVSDQDHYRDDDTY